MLIEEGMTVEKGQLLAVLDDSLPRAQLELEESRLAAAETALDEIKASIQQAELDLERTADLAERELASRADLDRNRITLKGLKARLAYAERQLEVGPAGRRPAAPAARRHGDPRAVRRGGDRQGGATWRDDLAHFGGAGGSHVPASAPSWTWIPSKSRSTSTRPSSTEFGPGQPVTARLNAYPDARIPAEVIATIPAADRSKATVRVRIGFKDRDSRVVPDMGVKVAFLKELEELEEETDVVEAPPTGMLVPKTAVLGRGNDSHVFVVNADDAEEQWVSVERREVQVGVERDSRIRVIDGLRAGERIVSDPPAGLGDGQRVVLAD